jgi:hypothetical protein
VTKANIVLATDMRFTNETNVIKQLGGYTVNVTRVSQDGRPFYDPARPADHISETQLDDYNYDYRLIVKTGDQALLEEYAITLIHYLRALKG